MTKSSASVSKKFNLLFFYFVERVSMSLYCSLDELQCQMNLFAMSILHCVSKCQIQNIDLFLTKNKRSEVKTAGVVQDKLNSIRVFEDINED